MRHVLLSGVDMARLRVDLLRAEAQEEFARLRSTILLGLCAIFFLALAIVCASVLLVAAFWDTHRLWALAGLAIFYLLAAVVLVSMLRRRARRTNGYRADPRSASPGRRATDAAEPR